MPKMQIKQSSLAFFRGRENVLRVTKNSHHIVYTSVLREIKRERLSRGFAARQQVIHRYVFYA